MFLGILFDLGELLGSLGISADSFDLEGLLGSLFDENGNVDLDGILGQFGVDASSLDIAGILDMIGGLGGERFSEELKSLEAEAGAEGDEVSLNDVEAMVNELISNPEEAKGLADSLFKEGGIAASLLDMLSGTSESLSGVVDSLKDSSGEYSLDRVVETLGTIEGNEEGVSIGGQELSQKEIEETVTQLLGAFGLSGEAAESNAAA